MRTAKTRLLIVLALSPLGMFGGCGKSSPPTRETTATNERPRQSSGLTVKDGPGLGGPGDVRVLGTVPPFRFRNQDGKGFGSKELDGRVWIATFIFTRCGGTCPQQTAEFARLQKRLEDHPDQDSIHLVSFTVDPGFDTPPVLKTYAEQWSADTSRWTFLTGERNDLWELSADVFKLPVSDAQDNPDMVITHSQQFILVDRAQRIRGYYDGLNEMARERLEHDLELVLQDPPGPLWVSKKLWESEMVDGQVYVPTELRESLWMKPRAAAQLATRDQFQVFCDFGFTDRQPESGITFASRVVECAGYKWKGVHYDHGNGVAIADVNGDGLHDIYFLTQLGGNQLVLNRGGGEFEDITDQAGVAVANRISVTASFADTDNDGDEDLYGTTVRGGNLLFENDGTGNFNDVSPSSGLDYLGHSSSAIFFDYDRDGLLDLFLTNVGDYTTEVVGPGGYYVGREDAFGGHLFPERHEQSILYRNTGANVFTDVSQETGLIDLSWTGDASPIDVNADGWPDLYVLNMQGHDEYYENVKGERFVKKSRELFPFTPWGSMGIKTFDYDNDGDMDVFVTDMHTDMLDDMLSLRRAWYAEKLRMPMKFPPRFLDTDLKHVMGNAFFRNDGGKFTEIAEQIGAENYWPWGLSVGDLNADGFDDVFITSCMNLPFRYGVNTVLLNNLGEGFLDSEFILGVEPRRDNRYATPWFELDCDSVIHSGDDLCQGRSGKLVVWGALGSRSSVLFDLDNDGDLDIVTNDFNSEPLVLISNLSEMKPEFRFLKVQLEGNKSNKNGLGATVQLSAGDQTYTKVHDGQSGYLSQSVYPLYFGLGDAEHVDTLKITWPSGTVQVVQGPIESNQLLTFVEE